MTVLQQNYSEEFKRAAVQKLLNRGNRTVKQITEDLGVSSPSLYEWRTKFGNVASMKKTASRPQDRSSEEKLKAITTYDGLPETKRGEFLRREGLKSGHIEQWRNQLSRSLDGEKMTKEERSQQAEYKRRIKDLEKELRRKDKALAETTALLVLKKKANLIWGDQEDE